MNMYICMQIGHKLQCLKVAVPIITTIMGYADKLNKIL